MSFVRSFDSPEELFRYLEASHKAADEAVESWQTGLKPGDYFMRLAPEYGLVIYGEVRDPMAYWTGDNDPSKLDPETFSEYEYEKDMYESGSMANERFAMCYSQACPDGELGNTHVCVVSAKLTRDQFERAQREGWPTEPRAVFELMGLNVPHERA